MTVTMLGSYMVNICPECGAQQADGWDTHFHGLEGRCPNADRVWAMRAVEVVPARWAEVADELAEWIDTLLRLNDGPRDDAFFHSLPTVLEELRSALAAYRALAGEEGV